MTLFCFHRDKVIGADPMFSCTYVLYECRKCGRHKTRRISGRFQYIGGGLVSMPDNPVRIKSYD